MQRFGFVRGELEVKTLILYVLARLGRPVRFEMLNELSAVDDAVDYFEFAQCLASLVQTGHATLENSEYKITKKGITNLEICEGGLARTVKEKVRVGVKKYLEKVRRDELIKTEISHEDGFVYVTCALSDDTGEIMSLKMKTAGFEQAKEISANFREKAEKIYNSVLSSF